MFQIRIFNQKHAISLRVTLIIALMVVGIIPVFIQNSVMLGTYRQNLIESRMQDIQNQCWILSNKMTRIGYLTMEPRDPLLDNEMSVKADMFNGRIVVVNRNFRIISDTFSLSTGKLNVSEEVIRCFDGENGSKYNFEKHYSALTIPIYSNSQEKEIAGVMIVTASTEDLLNRVSAMSEKGAFLQLMIFSVLAIFVFFLATLLMKPFRELQRMLNRAAEGDMDGNISSYAYKETLQITETINLTLKKLKAVDQSREEFVSNVSHELKTPITSIRVLADSLMGMEDVPAELYREFLSDISDEIERENKIIDDLLSLVRMDKTAGGNLNIAQVNINGLMELILKRLRPIAGKRNVELTFESIREVIADVDEMKLSLALSNLVENAIKYNVEGGWVRVTLDADHKFFYVKVADSGIGISEEFQEHVFERFYRVDKARSRETGGTGLGLSITKKIVLMHQGALKLQSKEGEGATFTVRIPLTYIS
ncbi:MAG: two-component sensor histidine kinase [Hungatella sp.]|jgi:signal transduction histidine kinase|nr:two-component sensor histidine kinase [Hungatella sp.]MDR1772652.1 two-component sensor histidine kinase [Hungatella sp.]MDR2023498.1 two-component sensor histidine kinase [Hungatella sp.]